MGVDGGRRARAKRRRALRPTPQNTICTSILLRAEFLFSEHSVPPRRYYDSPWPRPKTTSIERVLRHVG